MQERRSRLPSSYEPVSDVLRRTIAVVIFFRLCQTTFIYAPPLLSKLRYIFTDDIRSNITLHVMPEPWHSCAAPAF